MSSYPRSMRLRPNEMLLIATCFASSGVFPSRIAQRVGALEVALVLEREMTGQAVRTVQVRIAVDRSLEHADTEKKNPRVAAGFSGGATQI
jgi:hypothetical protein